MVRGCQKKIIYLKNTGSEVFEEAYFVLNEKTLGEKYDECDMVSEANKILDECISFDEEYSLGRKIFNFIKRNTIPFFLGLILGIIITAIIK